MCVVSSLFFSLNQLITIAPTQSKQITKPAKQNQNMAFRDVITPTRMQIIDSLFLLILLLAIFFCFCSQKNTLNVNKNIYFAFKSIVNKTATMHIYFRIHRINTKSKGHIIPHIDTKKHNNSSIFSEHRSVLLSSLQNTHDASNITKFADHKLNRNKNTRADSNSSRKKVGI